MFVAVIETGSFAKAAARRGASSGQASKLVAKLEADLGVQLLKRTTRALAPTEVGQAYYTRIKPLLEDFAALDASVRDASRTPIGSLRLSVPASFGANRLAPMLVDFAREYEHIRLDVNFTDRIVNLVDEGFDLAIRIGDPEDSSLVGRRLCDSRVAIVASPSYLEAHGAPATPEALATRECIIDANFRDPLVWRFRDPATGVVLSVPVDGRLRFSSAEACIAAAEAGLGVARAPTFIVGDRLRQGTLCAVLAAYAPRPSGIYAIYPPGRNLAFKVRVFVDYLGERLRGEPNWDSGW
jgi:DNA-binding transcriptional LysR family regulator